MNVDESIYCPFCHKHTALSKAFQTDEKGNRQGGLCWIRTEQGGWWMGICNSCKNVVLVRQFKDGNSRWKTNEIYPNPQPKPINDKIPEFIKSDLKETLTCFCVGSYRATAILCRRILQVICLDKGTKDATLEKQIDELFEMRIITQDIKDWAHSVRWVGNNAAHPSVKDDITIEKDDANDILELVEQIIHILYIAGDMAKEKKEKFKKKINKSKSD